MLTTEIQKNISINPTPKKTKKSKLFSIKKSQKKSNLQSFKKTQKKNFFQKKLNRLNKSKCFKDDVSLETNSTTNTFEEENYFTNGEIAKYFNEIEFVIKDICEKGFYSLENFRLFFPEEKRQQGETKNGSVKLLETNFRNIIENISPNEKIKLILDIDETIIYSQVLQEIQKVPQNPIFPDKNYDNYLIQNLGQDEYYIKIFEQIQKKIYLVKVKIRKGLALFFKKLTPFCEFYINTMASKSYISAVLKILEKDYDFFIKEENIMFTSPNSKKILDEKIIKDENFLILDDNICAWEIGFTPSIIPIQKFNDLSRFNNIDIFYQYYLFTNKIYCFNESKGGFIDSNKIPHCVEVTNNEKNIRSQLYDITEIIIKSFLLKKILNIPIRHCLHFIQNTILKNCKIYYQGNEQDFIYEIISLLGGIIINDASDIKNATHIIHNKNFLKNEENILNKDDNKYIIDVKWIFDCFFKFKKCDEKKEEYKV